MYDTSNLIFVVHGKNITILYPMLKFLGSAAKIPMSNAKVLCIRS